MNLLLSSAGRRNYLVRYFREALNGSGCVYAADATGDAPGLADADVGLVVPAFDGDGYVDTLVEVCRRYRIGMLVPLNDMDLAIVARAAPRLRREARTLAVVSPPAVVDRCLDKLASIEFLQRLGIPAPATFATPEEAREALARGRLTFPVIVKPRWGSGSIGVFRVERDDELDVAVRWCIRAIEGSVIAAAARRDPAHAVLVQQAVEGPEYGFDIVNDLQGRYAGTLARLKLGMRSGETDRAMTVSEPELAAIGERIGTALGHHGVLDCDAIRTATGWTVLEMNPRFGGGYPFSHAGGANIPAALLAWASGRPPDPAWFACADGVRSSKTHALVTSGT